MRTQNNPKSFIFCVHAHQPVGNFGGVFEEAVDTCYAPFFDTLERHPRMPVAFHMSGSLIDWLETNRPDFIEKLQHLSKKHEIEFLGGAYYEPIYGLIPKRDLIAQIARMQDKVERLFGKRPEGAWLTERVWDPELIGTLADAGVRYTILDDAHLKRAGLNTPATGYYAAEEGGRTLDLFASMKELRYLVPFREVNESLRTIRSAKGGAERVTVFADDIEKFGMWPGTAQWVYGQEWLDRFFGALEKDERIRLYTFSGFRAAFGPVKSLRVPHGSYHEMTEWAGGSFYNFLDKYPESRYMTERMRQVSDRVEEAAVSGALNGRLEESQTALYRAQCNCPYWHGVFGGLYLHHLRASVFENLIKAHDGRGEGVFEAAHFDSGTRWQLRQKDITSFFNPNYGAALEELDFLPKATNLLCTLQRRPEPYHRFVVPNLNGVRAGSPLTIHQILGVKDKGLDKKLCYDPFRRLSFLDHFFAREIGRGDFERSRYEETGDFTDGVYLARPEEDTLRFERKGTVRIGGKKHPFSVRKTVGALHGNALCVSYELKNEGGSPLRLVFGVEFNFSIGEDSLAVGAEEKGLRERYFVDSWRGIGIRLRSDAEVSMIAAPLETVSESEGGIEGTYQQLAVLFQRPMELAAGETKRHVFELDVHSHDR